MRAIAVLTSGGDAPGMNAAVRAIVRKAIYHGMKIYGIEDGYQGLIEDHIKEMDLASVGDIIHRGGTVLRSARCLEFKTVEGREKGIKNLEKYGIEGVIVIGGDGSFAGAQKLAEMGINAIGIPGTIDNDLGYTKYTIGFDTALNTVLDAVSRVRDTSSSHNRVNVIEVMGRNCGDIALFTGIAGGAESIVIPEINFDIDGICERLLHGVERGKRHSIIMLAEGIMEAQKFGESLEARTGLETRVTILGHTQRGGSPTAFDRVMATRMGAAAVDLLMADQSNRVIGYDGAEIYDMDIHEALAIEHQTHEDLYELAKILAI
ncbi:6-phosphofructokinase [Gottschalkiaceae bacterium SANA]|nr:6-phosphofructokinase [Gottschalkiaceae bacterium SANA]